jgi:hypothetical protein
MIEISLGIHDSDWRQLKEKKNKVTNFIMDLKNSQQNQ